MFKHHLHINPNFCYMNILYRCRYYIVYNNLFTFNMVNAYTFTINHLVRFPGKTSLTNVKKVSYWLYKTKWLYYLQEEHVNITSFKLSPFCMGFNPLWLDLRRCILTSADDTNVVIATFFILTLSSLEETKHWCLFTKSTYWRAKFHCNYAKVQTVLIYQNISGTLQRSL